MHFVAAGAALYGAFTLVEGPAAPPADERTIVVDRRELLAYMQFRANAFEAETFSAALDAMPEAEFRQLVDDYVEEEAMYREARSLGLDANDYVIRRRMVQKMEFLLGDAADPRREIDEQALRAYFDAHREDYAIEPSVTFTHVFFDAARRGASEARANAEAALTRLNQAGAGFHGASGEGDRFPLLKHYVERTLDYVASQMGVEFAADLAQRSPAERWQGPIRSAFGEHVVMLTERTERRYSTLDEIRSRVEDDYLRARAAEDLEAMRQLVLDGYRIDVRERRLGDRDAKAEDRE